MTFIFCSGRQGFVDLVSVPKGSCTGFARSLQDVGANSTGTRQTVENVEKFVANGSIGDCFDSCKGLNSRGTK